jgi:hypothetical protein
MQKWRLTAIAQRPYLVDLSRIHMAADVLHQKSLIQFRSRFELHPHWKSSNVGIGYAHQLNQKMRISMTGISHLASSEEYQSQQIQAGVGLDYSSDKWRLTCRATNILPFSQHQHPLRITWTTRHALSPSLVWTSQIELSDTPFPDIRNALLFSANQHWSFIPSIELWPISFGLSILYSFDRSISPFIGSTYDLTLGPSPMLGVTYIR